MTNFLILSLTAIILVAKVASAAPADEQNCHWSACVDPSVTKKPHCLPPYVEVRPEACGHFYGAVKYLCCATNANESERASIATTETAAVTASPEDKKCYWSPCFDPSDHPDWPHCRAPYVEVRPMACGSIYGTVTYHCCLKDSEPNAAAMESVTSFVAASKKNKCYWTDCVDGTEPPPHCRKSYHRRQATEACSIYGFVRYECCPRS